MTLSGKSKFSRTSNDVEWTTDMGDMQQHFFVLSVNLVSTSKIGKKKKSMRTASLYPMMSSNMHPKRNKMAYKKKKKMMKKKMMMKKKKYCNRSPTEEGD